MMKKYLFILPVVAALLCVGCTSLKTTPPPISTTSSTPSFEIVPGQTIQLPTPAQLNLNRSATQIVSAQYRIKGATNSYTSEVHIEANSQKLLLVAVSGWGGQLFTIDYNGKAIKSSSLPMPNANIGIQHTLTDFIFTYASPQLLKTMLASTTIKMDIKPLQRIFSVDHKTILQIDYQNEDPWKGKVILHNVPLNYTVTIQTVSVAKNVKVI